jgi:hypothetical protein
VVKPTFSVHRDNFGVQAWSSLMLAHCPALAALDAPSGGAERQ